MSKINKKLQSKVINISLALNKAPQNLTFSDASSHMMALMSHGQLDNAEHVAKQLNSIAPKELSPKLVLMRTALFAGDIIKAGTYVNQLTKDFPREVNALNTIASYHQSAGNFEKAIEIYKKITVLKPKAAMAHHGLGMCYLSISEKDKALACFEKAISINPQNIGAYFSMVNLMKDDTDTKHIQKMLSLLEDEQLNREDKARLHFSLSTIYKSTNKEKEIEHLIKGNELVKSSRPWDMNAWIKSINRHKQMDYPTLADNIAAYRNTDYSPIFIVSLPRSGSTLLDQIFGAHSKVKNLGETGAFSRAEKNAANELQNKTNQVISEEHSYGEYISSINNDFIQEMLERTGDLGIRPADKSLGTITFIGQILLTYPNAKIIHLKRNPNAIALSCYQTYFGNGLDYSFDLQSLANYYFHFSHFIEYWKSVFPDSIYSISYEDLVQKPETTLAPLLQFCDLDWEEECLSFHKKTQFINTASVLQANQAIYTSSQDRWREYEDMLEPFIKQLENLENEKADK